MRLLPTEKLTCGWLLQQPRKRRRSAERTADDRRERLGWPGYALSSRPSRLAVLLAFRHDGGALSAVYAQKKAVSFDSELRPPRRIEQVLNLFMLLHVSGEEGAFGDDQETALSAPLQARGG